jgi:GT2 family glycosyltransferase
MISIIIPNFNGVEHLKSCIPSLKIQSYNKFNITIIDNNSNDDSIKYIEGNYPDIDIIKLKYNSGFAKAVNIGILKTISSNIFDYVLLLNNDIECDVYFLEELVKGFINEKIGSVACKMLNYFERNKIDDAGNFINFKNLPYMRGHKEFDKCQYDTQEYIFGACAGAAMYKLEVFKTVGLFDEDFVSYFEDVDFSFRLQRFGYKCIYNPNSICYHKRGATGLKDIANHRYLFEKNIITLRIKNYPARLLFKYLLRYIFLSYLSFLKDIHWYSIKVALHSIYGHLKGLSEIHKSYKKRKSIINNTKVSNKYLIDVCERSSKI